MRVRVCAGVGWGRGRECGRVSAGDAGVAREWYEPSSPPSHHSGPASQQEPPGSCPGENWPALTPLGGGRAGDGEDNQQRQG